MRKMVEKIFRRYGSVMTLLAADGEEEFRGFLQHVNSRSRQRVRAEWTVLGEVPDGVYVLILPAALQVKTGDSVELAQERYTVYRLENAVYGDEVLYQWGLCVKEGGA
jgi:hypothetical protein